MSGVRDRVGARRSASLWGLGDLASKELAHRPESTVCVEVQGLVRQLNQRSNDGSKTRAWVVAYVIPRTSILGAILLTGYLGGATASHVRIGDPSYFPIVFGVLVWGGLLLRDDRLCALLPLQS